MSIDKLKVYRVNPILESRKVSIKRDNNNLNNKKKQSSDETFKSIFEKKMTEKNKSSY